MKKTLLSFISILTLFILGGCELISSEPVYYENPIGEITDIGEAGCPLGTTVIVRDLFCSTPARMKFLKKDFTEAGYIKDMLDRQRLNPVLSPKEATEDMLAALRYMIGYKN